VWDARGQGLGGWSLDIQHAYDPVGHAVYLGDGQQRDITSLFPVLSTTGGGAANGYVGDNGPASAALFNQPAGEVSGPDGSLYVADSNNLRVRKIAPDGTVTTFAGNGGACALGAQCGDGGPAVSASVNVPWAVALGQDGSLYIAEHSGNRVRRVAPDGTISTIAGTGIAGFSGDAGPAAQAQLNAPQGVVVGSDGSVYIADTDNNRIRRVSPSGQIQTVVGTGAAGFAGDGGSAFAAQLWGPMGLAMDTSDNLYIADWGNSRVRLVSAAGTISTVAGNGTPAAVSGDGGAATQAAIGHPFAVALDSQGQLYIDEQESVVRRVLQSGTIVSAAGTGSGGYNGDGLPAVQAQLSAPRGLTVAPDQSVSISDEGRIRRVKLPLPGFAGTSVLVPSEDGHEAYEFDATGRHLRTLDALTGTARYQFSYDSAGRLTNIADADGNTTQVQRDGNGNPTAIVSPDGLQTRLSLDANGFLSGIVDPANETVSMTSSPAGLLSTYTDARQNMHTFQYDASGRLQQDNDPLGGAKTLSRTEDATGATVTLTTSLSRITTFRTERLANGDLHNRTTLPDGTRTDIVQHVDGRVVAQLPDGMTDTYILAPDPRWGMLAPVVASETITSPSGLTETTTESRAVTLAGSGNPFAFSETDSLASNGHTFTWKYDSAGRTITTTTPAGRQTGGDTRCKCACFADPARRPGEHRLRVRFERLIDRCEPGLRFGCACTRVDVQLQWRRRHAE
jgi:YD repeat-containing protein